MFDDIPPSSHYPGMVKVRVGETMKVVQVLGWGAKARREAEKLARKLAGPGVDE